MANPGKGNQMCIVRAKDVATLSIPAQRVAFIFGDDETEEETENTLKARNFTVAGKELRREIMTGTGIKTKPENILKCFSSLRTLMRRTAAEFGMMVCANDATFKALARGALGGHLGTLAIAKSEDNSVIIEIT